MTLRERRVGAWTVVELGGRVDHPAASNPQARLVDLVREGCRAIILDCGGLTYLSSAGLRVLLLASQQQRENKLSLRLCGLNPNIRHFFELSGLSQWLRVYPSACEAASDEPPPVP